MSLISLTTRAGTSLTTASDKTSLLITEPAATKEFSPIVVPGNKIDYIVTISYFQ